MCNTYTTHTKRTSNVLVLCVKVAFFVTMWCQKFICFSVQYLYMQDTLNGSINPATNAAIYVYSDGGYRMQQDIGAWAYIIVQNNIILDQHVEVVKNATNNICEYLGMLNGIKALENINIVGLHIVLVSDSMLLINQVTNKWKINKAHLRDLRDQIHTEGRRIFGSSIVEFVWNTRDHYWTSECDKLCNHAIDVALS